LALATLLNVNYENTLIAEYGVRKETDDGNNHITSDDLEHMMCDFWKALEERRPHSIPPGIIFAPGPKLSIQGFRWAPKSWMVGSEIDFPDPMSRMIHPAELKTRGLFVRYPGIMLHSLNRSMLLYGQTFTFPIDNTLLEWYSVQRADITTISPKKGVGSRGNPKDLAIILSRPRPREVSEIGLLVEVVEPISQHLPDGKGEIRILSVHTVFRVLIGRERNQDKINKARSIAIGASRLQENGGYKVKGKAVGITSDEDEEGDEEFVFGEILPDDQGWFVDGRGPEAPPASTPAAISPTSAPQVGAPPANTPAAMSPTSAPQVGAPPANTPAAMSPTSAPQVGAPPASAPPAKKTGWFRNFGILEFLHLA
jgi:hypothetical protein